MNRRALMAAAGATLAAGLRAGGAAQAQPLYEAVSYESGGRTIRAILYPPQGRPRGAGVVMFHGSGGRVRSEGPWHETALRFAGDGYGVLVPSYMDAAADDGVRAAPIMDAWRRTARDGVNGLAELLAVSPERVATFGYSLGSYVAVDSALGDCRAGAAIGLAGGTDVYAPRAPSRRVPVLVLRCESDTHVSPQSTARWVDFLREREVHVRVQTVRGAGHILTPGQWADVFSRSSDFLARTIGEV